MRNVRQRTFFSVKYQVLFIYLFVYLIIRLFNQRFYIIRYKKIIKLIYIQIISKSFVFRNNKEDSCHNLLSGQRIK